MFLCGFILVAPYQHHSCPISPHCPTPHPLPPPVACSSCLPTLNPTALRSLLQIRRDQTARDVNGEGGLVEGVDGRLGSWPQRLVIWFLLCGRAPACVVACVWLLLGGEAWGHMSVATDQAWESGSRGGGRTWVGERNAAGASREERCY